MVNIENLALLKFLKGKDASYYGKVLEVREAISSWLEYIPATFPHYTRHTIVHSEAILVQLSNILFGDEDPSSVVIGLSGVEAYILVAGAFLHDAGMVVSDDEKAGLFDAFEWKRWTGEGGGAETRWQAIEAFRNGGEPADDGKRLFLADLQTRYLMAEYMRRVHHSRAGQVMQQHQSTLGRFAFDDPDLGRAIEAVCVGHGLAREALDDSSRYPLLRQIRGENVNLRLLAILLRLGDLLDLDSQRACPMLLNAACPLPAESHAHWAQYRAIEHRAVTSKEIQLRAACETGEIHRVFRDWCQWIVDEVTAAPGLLAGATRHGLWHPPEARMTGGDPTIIIKPKPGATYHPVDWRFELDEGEVFKRLIEDTYESPLDFIRELIQNGLDAMRCQMYDDLAKEGSDLPESPTKVDEDFRNNYVLKLSIREVSLRNENADMEETRQILTVEDCGIGMDEEVIAKNFLQVGKSFYRTQEFRDRYTFHPTSRFGIGFLSVFAASV